MKRFSSIIAIMVTCLSVVWPFAAVWLSAHQVISSGTERWTSLFCFLGAFLGGLYYSGHLLSKPAKSRWLVPAIVLPICAVFIVFKARQHSNRMFSHWMLNRMTEAGWQQATAGVEAVARAAAERKDSAANADELPLYLRRLGNAEKLWGVDSIAEFENGEVGGRLVFGDRNRKWGILVGPDEFLSSSLWKKFKHFPVSTNAVFFVGSDW